MSRIEIIRKGSKRSVMMDERTAHALVKNGTFSYAQAQVSKPKSQAKAKDEPRGYDTKVIRQEETKAKQEESLTALELNKLTVAQLREMATTAGVTIEPGSTKSDIVSALLNRNTYSTRVMTSKSMPR